VPSRTRPRMVELLGRGAPVRQPVVLPPQQGVEGIGIPVHRLDHGLRDLAVVGGVQLAESVARQWRLVVVVADRERPVPPLDGQLACLHDPAVVVTEHRHEHEAGQLGLGWVPVDVEVVGVAAFRPVLQDVPPPGVRPPADRHVVRHDVEHLAQPGRGQPPGEAGVRGGPAELRVDPAVVDHVVAVPAALGGLQVRRAEEVARAEPGQVAGNGGRVVETEVGVQLDAVGGDPRPGRCRRRGGSHDSHPMRTGPAVRSWCPHPGFRARPGVTGRARRAASCLGRTGGPRQMALTNKSGLK
jgi:hypothetical protein